MILYEKMTKIIVQQNLALIIERRHHFVVKTVGKYYLFILLMSLTIICFVILFTRNDIIK